MNDPITPSPTPQVNSTPHWVRHLAWYFVAFLAFATVVVTTVAFWPERGEHCVAPFDPGDGALCCEDTHRMASRASIFGVGFGWVFTISGYLMGLLGGLLGPIWAESATRAAGPDRPTPPWPRMAGTFLTAVGVSLGSVGTMLVERGRDAATAAAATLGLPPPMQAAGVAAQDQELLLHCSAALGRWLGDPETPPAGLKPTAASGQAPDPYALPAEPAPPSPVDSQSGGR